MIHLSSIQHSDSQFLRIIQDLSYFQNALICCVVLLILQSSWYYAFWLRWRQEPQNRLVEMGPGLWENHQEIKSAFPTPLCQEGVRGPCFSSGFCSCRSGQKLQVGQTHLERPAFSLLTPNDELFCFHLSAIASIWFIENYHKTQWHTEINVYFLLIYVLIDWPRLSWVWLSLCLGLDLLHVSFVTLGSAAPGSYFYGHA